MVAIIITKGRRSGGIGACRLMVTDMSRIKIVSLSMS